MANKRRRWRRPERMTLDGPPIARRKQIQSADLLTLDPADARRENRERLAALLATFVIAAGVTGAIFGWALGLAALMAPAMMAWAVGYIALGRRYGDDWMQRALGCEQPRSSRLSRVMDRVAEAARTPRPAALVIRDDEPNALAFGLGRRWIAVTTGAIRTDDLILEGIVAHEVVHLRDGDAAVGSTFALLAGVGDILFRTRGARAGWLLVLAIPLWPAAMVVLALRRFWFPKDREHRADVAGILLTRYPPGLAEGLSKAATPTPTRMVTDPLWFSPRVGDSRDIGRRVGLVGEM